MKEAGYTTDKPLRLTLTYANTYGTELGDQLKSQLAKIGIDLKIDYVEFSTWLQNVHANGDYELSLVDHAESHDFYKWTTPDYYYHYDGKQAREWYAKRSNPPMSSKAPIISKGRPKPSARTLLRTGCSATA